MVYFTSSCLPNGQTLASLRTLFWILLRCWESSWNLLLLERTINASLHCIEKERHHRLKLYIEKFLLVLYHSIYYLVTYYSIYKLWHITWNIRRLGRTYYLVRKFCRHIRWIKLMTRGRIICIIRHMQHVSSIRADLANRLTNQIVGKLFLLIRFEDSYW